MIQRPNDDLALLDKLTAPEAPSMGTKLRRAGLGFFDAANRAYGGQGGSLERDIADERQKRADAVQKWILQRKMKESDRDYGFKEKEAEAGRTERQTDREFKSGEAQKERDWKSGESEKDREFKKEITYLDRISAEKIANLKESGQLNEKQSKRVQDLRKEAQNKDSYKSALTASRGLGISKKFAQDPDGFTDYGSLMAALKSLQGDQSVIREAELKQGINATSMINKAMNTVQMALTGQKLQPDQRQEIINAIRKIAGVSIDMYKEDVAPIFNQVKDEGLPMNHVFSDVDAMFKKYADIPEPLGGNKLQEWRDEDEKRLKELEEKERMSRKG